MIDKVCPDSCRRGSNSSYMDGPWKYGSCGGLREDLNQQEARMIAAFKLIHERENTWLEHYDLPTKRFGIREARNFIRNIPLGWGTTE